MIPVKLNLSNFTSYGENSPELDFTKFHMAAISGPNGAGKSSLLDAITWCIWGTSRAGDSSDALVRLGQNEMTVEFSFELDGHIYIVKRRRSKKGGGSTNLEFWSGTLDNPQAHNLTEGTIKATQQKIIDALHLTYETFTNSAFLRQGHADEFTTQGPTDRKRILADILGLDHYDLLEERAKDKAKEAQTRLQLLEYQILEIEAELSQKEEREKSLSLAEEEAKRVEKDHREVEQLIKSIGSERQNISSTLQLLQEKKTQIQTIQKELGDLKIQIKLKEEAEKEFQAILSQKELIEINFNKLQRLQAEKKALEVKRSELITVKDQLADLQKTIIDLEDRRNKKITLLEVEVKKFQTENEQLQSQVDHLVRHKDTCPTCNQPIGSEKNKEIIGHHQKKIAGNNSELRLLEDSLSKCKAFVLKEVTEAEKLETTVKKLEEETKNWGEISSQILGLDKYSDLYIKLQQAETGVKTHKEAVLDLQKLYQSRQNQIEQSEKELKELNIYEEQLKVINDKLAAQETIKQELAQKSLELRSKVGEARLLVSRSEQLTELLIKRQAEKFKLTKEKELFEELALAFGKKGIQAMIIENVIPEIEDEANRLLERLTEGRMKVRFETQRETKTKVAGAAGVKTYGTVETLDIVISDEMGERSYELYSGGETFRVNFAIRLAISKLLTHRAGAKLQFLIIDEGFGTQDAPGRARLVEVLDTIKNDFEKILIVTHIEELKEEFAVRVEVAKNTAGSTFEVVGI